MFPTPACTLHNNLSILLCAMYFFIWLSAQSPYLPNLHCLVESQYFQPLIALCMVTSLSFLGCKVHLLVCTWFLFCLFAQYLSLFAYLQKTILCALSFSLCLFWQDVSSVTSVISNKSAFDPFPSDPLSTLEEDVLKTTFSELDYWHEGALRILITYDNHPNPIHPILSNPQSLFNHLNRPWIDLSRPPIRAA